jgi:hypothetical protein
MVAFFVLLIVLAAMWVEMIATYSSVDFFVMI